MKSTMQYSVGDEVAHVPSNEADEFNAVAKEQNITPEPIFTYRVSNKDGDVQQLDIPKAEYEEFAKTAGDNGYKIEPLRMMTMDDGSERYFSARELRAFMRSDEYLNSTDGAEAKARDEEMRRRIAEEEANRPGFWSELGHRMFTADGVRETAEESAWARPYAYANDLCNALVGGLLKGSAKISEGFGHLIGSESIVEAARNDQAAVDRALPTDMLETNEPGAVNKVLQVGKNVAGVTGEFAPSLIPGVGQAYAASLVGAGSTIRYMQVYDDAIAHGCDPDKATALASMGATVDAAQNMLLMGKFKGVWKGEQAALAEATKKSLVRRLTEDTLKVGATMAGGAAAGDVIDQAAEGAYWLDVKRTGKAGFDGFIEGGLFHLVNTGVHNAGKIGWHSEAKGIPAGAARDMMEAPEGRALIFANSPDAARAIFHARRRGEDVSRKMIEDLGLSGDVARTAADRNALGDRLMADYDAFKERVRTKMDDVQAAALADEIASRSEEGVNNPGFEKVWFKAVEQIKDATELDDPARRKEIVDAAVKVTETPAERRQREQAVEDAIKARQAEEEAAKKPVSTHPEAPKESVGEIKSPEVPKSVENPAPAKPVEAGLNKETPVAPSAPTPVSVRPATSAPAEALKPAAEPPKAEAPKPAEKIIDSDFFANKHAKRLAYSAKRDMKWDNASIDDFIDDARRLVKAINDKDYEYLKSVFRGGSKDDSLLFKEMTGISLPKTKSGQQEAISKFCGISSQAETTTDSKPKFATEKYKAKDGTSATLEEYVNNGWILVKGKDGDGKGDRLLSPDSMTFFKLPKGAYEYLKSFEKPAEQIKPAEKTNPGDIQVVPKTAPDVPKTATRVLLDEIELVKTVDDVDRINEELSKIDPSLKNVDTIKSLRIVARFKGSRCKKIAPSFGKKLTDSDVSYIMGFAKENGYIAKVTYDGELLLLKPFHRDGDTRDRISANDFELDSFLKLLKKNNIDKGSDVPQTAPDVPKDEKTVPKKTTTEAGTKPKHLTSVAMAYGETPTPVTDAADAVRDAQIELYKVRLSPSSKKRVEEATNKFNSTVEAFKKTIADPSVSLEELKAEADRFDEQEQNYTPKDISFTQHHNWAIGNAIRAEIARREGTEAPPERDEFHPQGEPEDPWMESVRKDEDAIAMNKRYRKAKTDDERSAIKAEFDKLVEKHKAEWEKQNGKTEEPVKTDDAKKPPLVPEKPVEKPVPAKDVQKNGTSERTIKEARAEIRSLQSQIEEIEKGRFKAENKDDEAYIEKEIDGKQDAIRARISEIETEIDSKRTPGTPHQPFTGKPNPAKAAKIVSEFVYKQTDKTPKKERRDNLAKVNHDKKNGVAVACDGRVLIATKHGFDPNGQYDPVFPDWKHIIPSESETPIKTEVNPTALAKTCKDILRLARATGEKQTPLVAIRFGEHVNLLNAENLLKVARAMEANGITTLRTKDQANYTVVADNADTTIAIMPFRKTGATLIRIGRGDGGFVVNGHNGRIVSAPSRTDESALHSPERLKYKKDSYEEYRKTKIAYAEQMNLYKAIVKARKDGETDVEKVYESARGKGAKWKELKPELRDAFTKWFQAKDDSTTAELIAEHLMDTDTSTLNKKSRLSDIAKIEKRIAAEDEIEGLIMRSQEARDFLGIKPEKKDNSYEVRDAEEHERDLSEVQKEAVKNDDYTAMMKQVNEWIDGKQGHQQPLNAIRLYVDTHEDTITEKMMIEAVKELGVSEKVVGNWLAGRDRSHKFNIDVAVKAFDAPVKTFDAAWEIDADIGGLIWAHLKAQATSTNNAAGRKRKADAKDALVNRLSSLTDEEYAGVKGRLKQIMEKEGFDPAKSGYVQAIFNAETAKRNAAKKTTASNPVNLIDSDKAFSSAYERLVDAHANNDASRTKETSDEVRRFRDVIKSLVKDAKTEDLKTTWDTIAGGMEKDIEKKGTMALFGKPMADVLGAIRGELLDRGPKLDKYLATKKPMEAARILQTLTKKINFGGEIGIVTESDIIERSLSDGSVVSAEVSVSKNGKPSIKYLIGDLYVSKTAADYARARGVKIDENDIARASERFSMIEKFGEDRVLTEGNTDRDTDIESNLLELEKKRKEIGNVRAWDYYKDKYDLLKSIRDARVKRGDWNPEPAKTETAKTEPAKTVAGIEAQTGKPFVKELFHGRGKSRDEIYNPDGIHFPVAGEGSYYAFTENNAKNYGDSVSRVAVSLKNPFVVRDDEDWRSITSKAGWRYLNPFGLEQSEGIRLSVRLKDALVDSGHDGIIIQFENSVDGDVNTRTGNSIKAIRDVFGHDQVVSYKGNTSHNTNTSTASGDNSIPVGSAFLKSEYEKFKDLYTSGKEIDKKNEYWKEVRGMSDSQLLQTWADESGAISLKKKKACANEIVARIKRMDGKNNQHPEKAETAKVEPGKFTDEVYKTYRSAPTYREGAKAFAEDTLELVRDKIELEIRKAENAMEDARGENGTYKNEEMFDENASRVEVLNGQLNELKSIEERIKHGFEDDGETKSEIHEGLRDILSEMNAISPIEGFEDIGRFKPRRGAERTGVKEIDDFNDKWDDEGVSKAKQSDLTFGAVGEAETEIERKVQEYFGQEIAFDKKVYDQLSDGDKRYFGKLMKELDDAKDDVCYKYSKMSDAVRYVEAHEAVEQFAESARKMGELMRDKDGRPVLFTDNGRATEMATDGVKRAVKAFLSRNPSEANAATEMIHLAIENGGDFPTEKQVAEMAKELPEELRDTFVRNVDDLRKYANGLKDEPSVADKATEIAGDVDAAIDAEERGGASGRPEGAPVMAPRGAGTGTLSQAEPMPQGTTITGKTSGIVTPQSFLKEARKLFPDIAIRAKGTVRMPKWAAGHFEPAYRIIRSRDMNAIRTITHELGHDLEYLTRYDLPRNPAAKRDLSDLGHALYPSGPGMPKPNSYIGEGFAEYIRGYICNADNLATVAPDMDAWFRGDFKAKHPEIVKKVNRLRDMVQTMKEQSACDTLRGFRHPATTVVERAWKKVTKFASSENWNDAASTILKGMKKSGIDKLYHWQDEFRELEEAVKAGDAVKAQRLAASVSDKVANHPYLFPTITRGTASQRVMDMARHGTTSLLGNQRTGESLKEIFADFSHKEQEAWKDYAIARHGIENYYAKGLEFGMPKEVLEEVVRQYDSPKFQQALQRVTDYSHRILHLGVDAGLISQETYDSIVANHPIYIRVTRRKADDMAGTKQGGAAISKRTGGFENILDPIDAMLMDQEKYLRACFQARSMQLIVQAAQRAKAANIKSVRDNGGPNTSTVNPRNQSHIAVGAYWPVEVPNAQEKVTFGAWKLKQGLTDAVADYAERTGEDPIPLQQFVDDLATYTDPMGRMTQLSIFRDKPSQGKHNQVSVYVDGKLHTYELPDMKWANMLTDVYDKSEFNPIERAFGIATAGIRLGATTINPGFAIRNGIRDSLHSAVMSESGALPMLGTLNGMLNQLTGKEAAQMFRSMGGHMSDLVGVTKEQKWHHGGQVALAQNPLQSLQAYGAIDWALMKPVIKVTSDILSIPELGPRVREFNGILQKCRAAGLNEDVCAMLAMSHAKDISIDFQRAGRYMKHINHFIPFSNAMWRGTEQTFRNLGVLPALPHQFEDRGMERGAKTVGNGLAYVTSWMATLAMLEMAGDDEDRRRAFEREPVEKWEYAHVGDWRIPLPFELGFLFGAIPKAAIYEMYGDEGAMKECLGAFNQAMPSKYVSPDTAIGSISILTPWIGLLKNEDYRGRAIVPEHIMENRVKDDWYTQYTTELSKRIGKTIGDSPAQLEYLLNSYTGGLYRRTALAVENIGDTSRLQEGRGFSMLDTLRARPQANRLVSDFYKFGEEAKQKLGSGVLSLEDYGKFESMNGVKEELTERFNAMRAIRADKSIPLAEQDKQVQKIADDVNETIRDFNARDDYRQRGIAYAASHLTGSTLESLDENTREQYTALLTGVPKNEIVQALIRFGNETVMVKQKGVPTPHLRWSSKNINERVGRLLMLMQGRD